jgi:hypothetical protein
MNSARKQVAVVVGATSKWQSDGRNTKLAHGKVLDDSDIPVGMRWGVGGAIAQKFAKEGFFVVLTTRSTANASALEKAVSGGRSHPSTSPGAAWRGRKFREGRFMSLTLRCVGSSSSWPWGCATCTPLRVCRTATGHGSRIAWYDPQIGAR